MKSKLFKTKSIIALALALFIVMPMLFAALPSAKADESGATPVLSIVAQGAAGSASTTYLPASAVGSQFTVDIRLDNSSSVTAGINGATYTIGWNPAVLSFVSASDGAAFWGPKLMSGLDTSVNSSAFAFNQPINGGNNASACAVESYGVLGSITFQVIAQGQSQIAFDQSGNNLLYLTYPDSSSGTGSSDVANVQYVSAVYNLQTTSINLVSSGTGGTTNQASYQFPTGVNPIGNTFQVDLYMNNEKNESVWAWNIGVSWNPAVLQLVNITEGTYMNPTPGLYSGSQTLFVPGWVDNTAGDIPQGISDIYLSNTTATNTAGVMATLTFEVINYANSAITLSPGIPTLTDNYNHAQNVDSYGNFMYYGSAPPAAHAPVAVITNEGSPTYIANEPFTINAQSSLPGYDPLANPLSPNVPITGYSWTVTNGATTLASGTTSSITFNAPATVNGNMVVSLTVTTPTTSDSSYVNTNTATLTIAPGIIPPGNNGALIDLYIINNGTGTAYPQKSPTGNGVYNSVVDSYAPQQVMNLGTYVSFNNGEVSDKLVTFVIYNETNPSMVIGTFVAYTDNSGNAYTTYRLPNYNSAVMPFGTYEITASVDVAQVVVNDSIIFQYGYTLTSSHVSVTPLVARGRDSASMSVQITNISPNTAGQTFYITYTVTDVNGVPVFSGETAEWISAAPATPTGSNTVNFGTFTLPIPVYAFAGTATVHVNIFNADPSVPSANALPYCPESDATFTIGLVPSS